MSDIVQITTHEDDAVARLIGIYQGKPRMEVLVRLLARQVQRREDAIIAILIQSAIDNAVGAQLVQIGNLVGQPQNGQEDDEYRAFIRARIKVNFSEGKLGQLLTIALLILGVVSDVTVRDKYPSGIEVEADQVTVNALILWRDFLHKAKGAAKSLQLIYGKEPDDEMLIGGSFYAGALPAANDPGSTWTTDYGGGETAGVFG